MKIDICKETYTINRICRDLKYCCEQMKTMVDYKFIEFGEHYPNRVLLNLRDYVREYMTYGNPERIPTMNSISISYCPFCGEKIET